MIRIIVQVLLAILVFRLIGSLVGFFRGKDMDKSTFKQPESDAAVGTHDYSKITPYDIEDAEFEELPKKK